MNVRSSPLLLRGWAPLVLAVLLAVVAIVAAPSVAPERVVVRPSETTPTTVAP